ncbi:hypothetical protein CHS0354_005513 [Potamilus streckersoni]|uniref:Uncharacterized protein n=1 Tax=Potamilus streckersoni TaxID=2493646 RepID=A0AAE0RYC5_9BIVA|nr:hypothetical protein CHS0354_005513 [Potamilus streckersoni]
MIKTPQTDQDATSTATIFTMITIATITTTENQEPMEIFDCNIDDKMEIVNDIITNNNFKACDRYSSLRRVNQMYGPWLKKQQDESTHSMKQLLDVNLAEQLKSRRPVYRYGFTALLHMTDQLCPLSQVSTYLKEQAESQDGCLTAMNGSIAFVLGSKKRVKYIGGLAEDCDMQIIFTSLIPANPIREDINIVNKMAVLAEKGKLNKSGVIKRQKKI